MVKHKLVDEFPPVTRDKINTIINRRQTMKIEKFNFPSQLLMAPMAGITNAPFRALIEALGAGSTTSELISCHGIGYKNPRTIKMLTPHPAEQNWGIQLFGEDARAMATAAAIACEFGPKFIDINAGCPVKKVVGKGGGSALMQNLPNLSEIIVAIKKVISVPLTLKIRIGWDHNSKNGEEVVRMAADCGVDLITIHGRTRMQQYGGLADWEFIENIAQKKIIPIIGNGDLRTASTIFQHLQTTHCDGLMIGRGALRNPFIFLTPFDDGNITFDSIDYWNVIQVFYKLMASHFDSERIILVQTLKHIVWFAAGFNNAAHFRAQIYREKNIATVLQMGEEFFHANAHIQQQNDHAYEGNSDDDDEFLNNGHG